MIFICVVSVDLVRRNNEYTPSPLFPRCVLQLALTQEPLSRMLTFTALFIEKSLLHSAFMHIHYTAHGMSTPTLLLRKSWTRAVITSPLRRHASTSSYQTAPSSHHYTSVVAAVAATTALIYWTTEHQAPTDRQEGISAFTSSCAPRKAHAQTLYVTGSESGRGLQETVIGKPRMVPLPGPPGPIDSVSFGPSWAVVAKAGNVYLLTGIGGAKEEEKGAAGSTTTLLYEAGGGWLGRRTPVVQVACTRSRIYGRTETGDVLHWTLGDVVEDGGRREGSQMPLPPSQLFQPRGPYRYREWGDAKGKRPTGVAHVSAGPEHAVFVLTDGSVHGAGENKDGRLGLGPEDEAPRSSPSPLRMQLPEGTKAVTAACGNTHTLVLDEAGGVWSCGADPWYQLGLGETWKVTKDRPNAMVWQPRKVRVLEDMQVGNLAAGGHHSLFAVLVKGGGCWVEQGNFSKMARTPARVLEVWATGFGQYGQLGDRSYAHLSTPRSIKELRILTYPEVTLPFPLLACGENHSAAVVVEPTVRANKNGGPPPREAASTFRTQAYVWGHNLGGQCGTGRAGNVGKPVVVEGVGGRVDAVVCGYDYTGFLVAPAEGGKETGGEGRGKSIVK